MRRSWRGSTRRVRAFDILPQMDDGADSFVAFNAGVIAAQQGWPESAVYKLFEVATAVRPAVSLSFALIRA